MRGAVAQAEEAFRVAKRRQEEGLGITLEVLNAEATLAQTTLGLTHMTYEYYRDLATLAQTVGLTTDDMVALIAAAAAATDQGEESK
jgi:outer membrane protein TolC